MNSTQGNGPGDTAYDARKTREKGVFCAAGEAISEMLKGMGPSENVRAHFRNARVEILKGFRAMLDQRIERVARRGEKGTPVVVE